MNDERACLAKATVAAIDTTTSVQQLQDKSAFPEVSLGGGFAPLTCNLLLPQAWLTLCASYGRAFFWTPIHRQE